MPIAALLTDALPTLWQIGTAIGGFFAGLAFNPKVWAGVAVAGLSVVLFLVSGLLRGRRRAAARETPAAVPSTGQGRPLAPGGTAPQSPQRKAAPAAKRPPNRPPNPRRNRPTTTISPMSRTFSSVTGSDEGALP
ncbi:hypothetical protein ACFQX6_19525 [Streptosporangium lutulentum]